MLASEPHPHPHPHPHPNPHPSPHPNPNQVRAGAARQGPRQAGQRHHEQERELGTRRQREGAVDIRQVGRQGGPRGARLGLSVRYSTHAPTRGLPLLGRFRFIFVYSSFFITPQIGYRVTPAPPSHLPSPYRAVLAAVPHRNWIFRPERDENAAGWLRAARTRRRSPAGRHRPDDEPRHCRPGRGAQRRGSLLQHEALGAERVGTRRRSPVGHHVEEQGLHGRPGGPSGWWSEDVRSFGQPEA